MTKTYWTYIENYQAMDFEFKTRKALEEYLDEKFLEECENDGIRHNETMTGEVEIIEFSYNDDLEHQVKLRDTHYLECTGYHGDLKEHGTW